MPFQCLCGPQHGLVPGQPGQAWEASQAGFYHSLVGPPIAVAGTRRGHECVHSACRHVKDLAFAAGPTSVTSVHLLPASKAACVSPYARIVIPMLPICTNLWFWPLARRLMVCRRAQELLITLDDCLCHIFLPYME